MVKTLSTPQPPQVVVSPKFEDTKSPDYKTIYTTGVFGGLDPNDGKIIFFIDHLVPKTTDEPVPGASKIEKITREYLIEIHMTPTQFKGVAIWMGDNVKRYEELFGSIPMALKGKGPPETMAR
jgi:hypothetical protein